MKILSITSGIWSMGPGKGMPSLHRVQSRYAARGHKVVILTPRPSWVPADIQRETVDGLTVQYVNVPMWRWSLPPSAVSTRVRRFLFFKFRWLTFVLIATLASWRTARAFRPDVLYGHDPYGIPVAYLLRLFLRVPNVSRIYGTVLWPFFEARDWGRIVGHVEDVVAFVVPASALIVTDDGTRGDLVAQHIGVSPEKVHLWMNGVDFGVFDPSIDGAKVRTALGLPPDCPLTVSVTRLDWWKRVERFVTSAPAVHAALPSAAFLIVGDGPERARIEALATRLDAGVKFLGSVTRDRVKEILNAADLFVAVADISNLGNNLLEAMACAKAILALDSGDTSRVIKHMETGYLLRYDELPQLPQVIVNLLKDTDLRQSLGAGARGHAKAHFPTWEARADREIDLVQKLVAKDPGRHPGDPGPRGPAPQ